MRAACVLLLCLLSSNPVVAAPWPVVTDQSLDAMRAAGWNFHSRNDANTRLYLGAVTVTEFEGPWMVQGHILDRLLRAGVPADTYNGCFVLAASARTRNRAAVQALLAAKAPVQARDPGGLGNHCDALADGAMGGDPEIVRQLLARHPDPDGIAVYGNPLANLAMAPAYVPGQAKIPLPGAARDAWQAARDRSVSDIAGMLLAAGANPRKPLSQSSNTAETVLRRMDFRMPRLAQVLDAWVAAHPVPPPTLPAKTRRFLDRWLDAQTAGKP